MTTPEAKPTTKYRFVRRFADGTTAVLGTAAFAVGGWRFFPNQAGRRPSKKLHPSMEKCLPPWVGYPDRCESEAVS